MNERAIRLFLFLNGLIVLKQTRTGNNIHIMTLVLVQSDDRIGGEQCDIQENSFLKVIRPMPI
jgi:hypothetical protein